MKKELGFGRCGLACCLCSENAVCDGCASGQCADVKNCENFQCSLNKGLSGCFACAETDCRKGLLKKIKPRVFTRFLREFKEAELVRCLERNEKNGIVYHRAGIIGDYDAFDCEEDLLELIQNGKKALRG